MLRKWLACLQQHMEGFFQISIGNCATIIRQRQVFLDGKFGTWNPTSDDEKQAATALREELLSQKTSAPDAIRERLARMDETLEMC